MVDTSDAAMSRGDATVLDDGGDAQLVADVLAGDRDAMGDLYDRYADRIHTMCAHMLRDADEAADVTGQVFLTALQRLHQLRDPAKLRPWLYAIARHEVYRRTKRRSRERPVERIDEVASAGTAMAFGGSASGQSDTPGDIPGGGGFVGIDETDEADVADLDGAGADQGELAALLQTAALGLDDRDRMVLELNLTQGLDGDDLAAALGVKVDNAYQMTHRMKERLERSMSALLVVSAGRDLCADLDGVAKKWDGTYDVLWRKRFARHVDRCDRCQKMRSKLPRAVLSGAALSQAAQAAVLAAPISIRQRVLAEGPSVVATETARPWSADGFPVDHQPRRRWRLLTGSALALLLVVAFAGSLGTGVRDPDLVETDANAVEVGDRDVSETVPLNPAPNNTAGVDVAPDNTAGLSPAPENTAGVDAQDPAGRLPFDNGPAAPPPPPQPDPRSPTPPAGTVPGSGTTVPPRDPPPPPPADPREPRDPQDPRRTTTTTTTRPRVTVTITTPTIFIPPTLRLPPPPPGPF